MSVRAYRVNKIETKNEPSFNLWNNQKLTGFFEGEMECIFMLQDGGGGTIEIPVKVLKQVVKNAKKLELEKENIATIKDDIRFAEKKGDEYVLYSCW